MRPIWTDRPLTHARPESPAFVHLVAFAIIAGCLLSFAIAWVR